MVYVGILIMLYLFCFYRNIYHNNQDFVFCTGLEIATICTLSEIQNISEESILCGKLWQCRRDQGTEEVQVFYVDDPEI